MPKASDDKQLRVHVVGCPRSGTTLMTELLRYSYEFAGAAEHEQSLFDAVPGELSPFLSKKPADTIRIGQAFEQDPNLYVVALVRDPRAVITSVHWSHPEVYFVGFARWLSYANTIRHYAEHPRYLVVRYEDLLATPDEIQRQVNEHLSFMTPTRAFSRYPEGIETLHNHAEKALNGVRPFDSSRVNAWQQHLGRVAAEVALNPGFNQQLERFGYVSDAAWMSCLEGVEPTGSSYKDGVDEGLRKVDVALRYWWKTRQYLRQRR